MLNIEYFDTPLWGNCPKLTIKAKLAKIDWDCADGYDSVANEVPNSTIALSDAEEIELYPYGCAKLRMTEIPFIKN